MTLLLCCPDPDPDPGCDEAYAKPRTSGGQPTSVTICCVTIKFRLHHAEICDCNRSNSYTFLKLDELQLQAYTCVCVFNYNYNFAA